MTWVDEALASPTRPDPAALLRHALAERAALPFPFVKGCSVIEQISAILRTWDREATERVARAEKAERYRMNLQTVDDLIEDLLKLTPAQRRRFVRMGGQFNDHAIVIEEHNGTIVLKLSARSS